MTDKTNTRNILVVFWNLGIGGIQRKIVDLTHYCEGGKYKNCRFHILLRDKTAFRMDNQVSKSTAKIYYRPRFLNGKLHVPFTIYMIWKIYQIRPVTLLTFLDYTSFLSIIAAKTLFWRKIRIVLNEDILTSPYVNSSIKRRLIKFFYPIADIIISPTTASQNDLIDNFSIPANKITVVPNWTLMSTNKHKVKPVFDLLYAGRFDEQKNLLFLLRVIKQVKKGIPNLKACFIGDGNQRKEMQKFIRYNHLRKTVIIKKGIHNLASYFRKVKIFAMSSTYEGMPVVLLEAMAAGLSVVTKKCPGSDEYLVNGKTAFIEDNIDDYVQRVEILLKQPNLRRKIGNYASRYVQTHFSEDGILKYIEVLLPKVQTGL